MTRLSFITLITAMLLTLSGCNQSATSDVNNSIEAQAWALMEQGAVIIDVRTEEEYAQGHLANSLLMPYDQIATKIGALGDNKEQQIVLYCRSGKRAGKAEAKLREMGYSKIFNGGGYQSLMEYKQP